MTKITAEAIKNELAHVAHNYHPLPVVIDKAAGSWVTDIEGNRYLDCLAAYSAVNFGHCPPNLVAVAKAQLDKSTLVSRAFHSAELGPFVTALAELANKDAVLPMNTGAEAVESGIKVARRWSYEVKKVPYGQAEIIVASGNFHGRTTTIVSFSDDDTARNGYAPFAPGFIRVPYGDARAIEAAITANTAAVLIEPIQGEAGVNIPPADYLPAIREICTANNVLFIADEIQSGLGRTGATFECENAGVVPDMYLLGKALGAGIVPVSAVVANWDILKVLTPGSHGSTFGGNPMAAAVGKAVVDLLKTGEMQTRAKQLGQRLSAGLQELIGQGVTEVRCRGLWAGVDIDPEVGTARDICINLMELGILAKDTHGQTVRLAPPLIITADEIDWLLTKFKEALDQQRFRLTA